MDRKTEIFIAFAAGVVAGVLLAPQSGEETRKKIADTAGDLLSGAKERVGERTESLKVKAGALKDAVQTARETFREELERTRT